MSGYLIGSPEANKIPLPPKAELDWWYQYYSTPRSIGPPRRSTTRTMSPSSSTTIVGDLVEGEAKYDAVEKRLAEAPLISVPTITLESDANGAPHPDPTTYAKKFGAYAHRLIGGGIGHNLPQEAPQAFAQAVVDAGGY